MLSPTGHFVDATPIEGTVVINAGDLLARWSNDTIKSTIHRVVEPPRKEGVEYPPRYSIACALFAILLPEIALLTENEDTFATRTRTAT